MSALSDHESPLRLLVRQRRPSSRPYRRLPTGRRSVVSAATIDNATALATRSSFMARPAWLFVLAFDVVMLTLPAAIVDHGRWSLAAMIVLDLLLLQACGQYRSRLHLPYFEDLFVLLGRGLVAYLVVAGLDKLVSVRSIGAFTVCAVLAAVFQCGGRATAYLLVSAARTTGVMRHDALVVGGGEVARRIATTIRAQPAMGLRVVGCVADEPERGRALPGVEHLGGVAHLAEAVERSGATVVIVAFNGQEDRSMVEALRRSERRGCDLFIVPRLFEIYAYGQSETIGGIPVVRVRRPRLNRTTWLVKRSIDVLVSLVALLVLSPVLLAAALAVRLEGGPGVIFRQVRIGLDGRTFELLKFRSLRPSDESESQTLWNVSQDDRLGPVGRVLRRTSVDELPQLLNVLKGEMTLVGPRPERPHFVEQFSNEIPDYRHRHRVPAGMTGLAQISGLRGDTSIADRARFDNFYIENWTLWLDVKIMAATIREVVGARGA